MSHKVSALSAFVVLCVVNCWPAASGEMKPPMDAAAQGLGGYLVTINTAEESARGLRGGAGRGSPGSAAEAFGWLLPVAARYFFSAAGVAALAAAFAAALMVIVLPASHLYTR